MTREELKNWYGEDFSKLKNESELNRFVQKHLKNEEKIDQLFNY